MRRFGNRKERGEANMRLLYTGLDAARPYVLSIVRIITALLFLEHGLQKYFHFPSAGPAMRPLLYVQGLIEIIGGVLLCLGIYTRIVAFFLAGDMAVAYFIAHAPRSFYPAVNGGDAAVLYCFIFLYFVFAGGGPLSLDRVLVKRG